jgi:hypothetical protein
MIIFIGVTSLMNIPVRGAMRADLTGGPIWGSGVAPSLTRDPLTDEYKSFIFFTTACSGCLSKQGASKTGRICRAYNNKFTI